MSEAGEFGAIGGFLRAPTLQWDLEAFRAGFEARTITFKLEGLAGAAAEPALAGRIRGAIGHRLLASASPESVNGAPCPWSPPCAFEALFRKQGRMTPGTDFPSPWVLAITPRRENLEVAMTIFGAAREWAPAAAEALGAALAHDIDWTAAVHGFAAKPRLLERKCAPGEIPPGGGGPLILDFTAPLVVTGQDAGEAPQLAFRNLGLRLEGVARWHGAGLAGVDWRALNGHIDALDWAWSGFEAVPWTRGSTRQGRMIAMKGGIGRLSVSGPAEALAAIAPLVALGEATHVGADVMFGCGRYRRVGA